MSKTETAETELCSDIPMPIVRLNRWMLLSGILIGLVLQQPLITTFLFVILLFAVLYGQRGSLIFQVGKRLLASRIAGAEGEDRRLMRFNNSIAVALLGAAQVAFLFGQPIVGWGLSLVVAAAAAVALAGFCFGCFLFLRFKLYRYRLLGSR
ncbi:MAG: DUF4395 domain-containing protein [Chloroflexia bacterium]